MSNKHARKSELRRRRHRREKRAKKKINAAIRKAKEQKGKE